MAEKSTTPDLAELVRTALDAGSRGDLDTALSAFAPDCVWDDSAIGLGTHEGFAAIREHLADWSRSYEELEVVNEEALDLGNGVTFTVNRQKGRLVGSIGYVHIRYADVAVWAEGMIERFMVFTDIDAARAAAERLVQERSG
jgi:ketosteroid isomerase-like protein